MTPQTAATLLLSDFYYDFLVELRTQISDDMAILREEANIENEVIQPALVGEIKTIGSAIEIARATGADDEVIKTLIQQVQAANKVRHDNRVRLRDIAYHQAVNKAMFAEVSREISYLEDDATVFLSAAERDFGGF